MSVSRCWMRWLAVFVALPLSLVVGPASAQRTFSSDDARRDELRSMTSSHRSGNPPRAVSKPLVFGVYPGGAAGSVGPSGQTRPEVPEARRHALRQLRGGVRPFVLHVYEPYTRPSDAAAVPPWLASEIADYTADGFHIELSSPTARPIVPATWRASPTSSARECASSPAIPASRSCR